MNDIPWAAIAPIILLWVAYMVFGLRDIATHDVRYLPKWAWALILVLSVPAGGIIYFLVGREPGGHR